MWEISLKYSLKKLHLKQKTPEQFYEALDASYYECKPMDNLGLITFSRLPVEHKDPFDRAIIGQSIVNDLILIRDDPKLEM